MIHKYRQNGLCIVLDICSGAVHVVDDIAFDLLDTIEPKEETCPQSTVDALSDKYSEAAVRSAYGELYALYQDGQLFTEDDYQVFEDKLTGEAPVKALCLHIAHDCNLRCQYCFASTGDFGTGRKLMDFETGKKAIDFVIEKSADRHNLEVDFFGGEPLMNFDVVKEIVQYARSIEKEHGKLFRFTVTTNGMLLDDDIIDFCNREMSNVVLSIDGRKEINDRLRKTLDGSSCYEQILPKFKELVERRGNKNYYVRGTFTRNNLDFAKDVLHLNELGFGEISVEPAVLEDKYTFALKEEDIPVIFKEYENLTEELLKREKEGRGFNFFHFMIDLEQGPCAIKRLRGCGCGNEYVAITPDGDIYPCHQFVGNEQWRMGSVHTGEFDREMKKMFASATVAHKKDCKECWARFYCSGGCNANSANFEGDIFASHRLSCEMEKKRVECAIYRKARLAGF